MSDPIDDTANNSPLDCLLAWVKIRPDAAAVARLNSICSYANLLAGIQLAATWLHGQGVRENDRVATLFAPQPDETLRQIELAYAVGWLGATLLPLYPGTARDQVVPVLSRFQTKFLLVSDELATFPGHEILPWPKDVIDVQIIAVSGYATAAQFGNLNHPKSFLAPGVTPGAGVPMCPQQPMRGFLYEFSSGTSGAPKVVLQSNGNYLLTAKVSGRAQGWKNTDVFMGAMRWPHKLGVRAVFRAHCMGATLLDENFPLTRSRLTQLVGEAGLSSMTSTPVQLRMLLASPVPDEPALPLRLLSTSGAALDPGEVKNVRAQITPNFYAVYDGTETGIVALLHPDDPEDAPMRVVPGVDLVAVDALGQTLPFGQSGRLRIRSSWVCDGYFNNDSASAESFQGGWYVSNDLAEISGDKLRLGSRADDMVNFGGGKVDPFPVEEVLRQHPDVADAAVVAMADVWEGQVPVAFVVLRQTPDLDVLRQYVDTRLDAGQRPVFFVVSRALPYNPDGKIKRNELRKIADQLRSRVGLPSDMAPPV